eukprot:CAMPEP_0170890028 /NCGR_PEP_ID=MMETSP0734-20130129/39764_1 /TAXON_ID=186038 /ORGANISM="Fragilariopsis kerguelensis, Strain L26-C5" /LENGTH=86 /DNA_ID=CAMNT_0011278619 /DNA_START=239 /DNA_END=496 /DNA_ORIENTATION=-
MASTNKSFVDGFDNIVDGVQLKLRDIVVSTISTGVDDSLVDGIDKVLDGIQYKLRNELSKAMEQATKAMEEEEKEKIKKENILCVC